MKQVIVMRNDLNMRKGKMIVQGAHASIAFVFNNESLVGFNKLNEWMANGQTKICVYVNSEKELEAIYQQAKKANLECHIIKDAGKTEFKGAATKTCLAIGPDDSDKIDKITGLLPLL